MFTTQQMDKMDVRDDHRDDRRSTIAFCFYSNMNLGVILKV